MLTAEETKGIIERARAKGVDMSWLQPQAAQATVGGVERLSPGASQLMDAVRQAQAQTPVYMPFPGGTPTQQRRQAEEASRQFDAGQEFSREKFDWEKDLTERQFAADQAYRNSQLALKNAASGGLGDPWANVDMAISMGLDLNTVMRYVDANESSYKKHGTTLEKMREYARGRFAEAWQGVADVSAPPRGASPADVGRGFRQLEEASSRVKQADVYGSKGKFADADYQRFADATGKTVAEIKEMDKYGWLEGFMKSFYGAQFKWDGGADDYGGLPFPGQGL